MLKSLFHTDPENPQKINKNNKWELDYWSNRLHIPLDELKKLIRKVGPNVSDIKKALGQ